MEWFELGETSKSPAMGRDIFHCPRVLQAPSSLAWNISRDGESKTSEQMN